MVVGVIECGVGVVVWCVRCVELALGNPKFDTIMAFLSLFCQG
jgi:hypothetical protein